MKIDAVVLHASFRHTVRKVTLSITTALVLLAVTSCKDDNPEPPQASGCRLVLQTNTFKGPYSETITYTYLARIAYTYDDKGNETGLNVSYNYEYSDGTTAVYAGTTSKQYDDQGFLLRTINQSNRTERDKSTNFNTSNTEHQYENGRLIKSTTESSSSGSPKQTYNYVYEYNSDGNLTKFTNISSNEVTTIAYNGTKISKVTQVDAKGVATSPFFEYNSKGLLVKWIETGGGYTEEYRYEYDNDGQVTRRERYINGKTSSADQTEYDTRQSPYQHQIYLPKGHPNIPSYYAEIVYKNNTSRGTYYDGDPAGTGWEIRSSTVYTYDYNATGFPVSATSKTFDKTGTETSTYNSIYEYENCN